MTLVLFWDIDGTLLTTERAGIFAWEDAIEEILEQSVSLQDYKTAGLTDVEIAALLVTKVTGQGDEARAAQLLRSYELLLPSRLHRRKGRALPGVREVLKLTHGREDILSILLTGNTAAGARAKLEHYGLDGYFTGGAFADGTPDRPAIAHHAFEIAAAHIEGLEPRQAFVIGDTPHDIHAGDAIGVRTVAVATGGYSAAQLEGYDPWWLLEQLPAADEFLGHLRTSALELPS
ncbi:MAG TPA: haloacid dehalogenase-like hydrolase [Acidobacteriota bacterium]|nr:haloacid dehalogenase-like hydrolase [Acidobacteriota bacterium]